MYYIRVVGDYGDVTVGRDTNVGVALEHADNIGKFFSGDGVTRPQGVILRIHNSDYTVFVERRYYNGYYYENARIGV